MGKGKAYSEAILQAYWHDAKDIGDLNVLADIAESVGLDRQKYLAALNDEGYLSAMMADVEQAFHFGLQGVPAMIFANKFLVSGAQPLPVLEEIIEKVKINLSGIS